MAEPVKPENCGTTGIKIKSVIASDSAAILDMLVANCSIEDCRAIAPCNDAGEEFPNL